MTCWQCRASRKLLFRIGKRSYCSTCYQVKRARDPLALRRLEWMRDSLPDDHPRQPIIDAAIRRVTKEKRRTVKPTPRPTKAGVRLPRGPKPSQDEVIEMFTDFVGEGP